MSDHASSDPVELIARASNGDAIDPKLRADWCAEITRSLDQEAFEALAWDGLQSAYPTSGLAEISREAFFARDPNNPMRYAHEPARGMWVGWSQRVMYDAIRRVIASGSDAPPRTPESSHDENA